MEGIEENTPKNRLSSSMANIPMQRNCQQLEPQYIKSYEKKKDFVKNLQPTMAKVRLTSVSQDKKVSSMMCCMILEFIASSKDFEIWEQALNSPTIQIQKMGNLARTFPLNHMRNLQSFKVLVDLGTAYYTSKVQAWCQ